MPKKHYFYFCYWMLPIKFTAIRITLQRLFYEENKLLMK